MHKLLAVTTLFAAAPFVVGAAPAAAGGVPKLSGFSAAGPVNPELVLVGGMGGGGGGMGGGAAMGGNTGGMGSGSAGGMGGGSNEMNGNGFGSNMFGGAAAGSGQPAADPTESGGQYYTYRCVTPAGRCLFVAPAGLRDNSLRSGAVCACPDSQSRGQVE